MRQALRYRNARMTKQLASGINLGRFHIIHWSVEQFFKVLHGAACPAPHRAPRLMVGRRSIEPRRGGRG
jgi:hypothetical protein